MLGRWFLGTHGWGTSTNRGGEAFLDFSSWTERGRFWQKLLKKGSTHYKILIWEAAV